MTIVELIAAMRDSNGSMNCADKETWDRVIPKLLNLAEKAIAWREWGDADCEETELRAAIDAFIY